jgi:hypothetical protein
LGVPHPQSSHKEKVIESKALYERIRHRLNQVSATIEVATTPWMTRSAVVIPQSLQMSRSDNSITRLDTVTERGFPG